MIPSIEDVKLAGDYRIWLRFQDGVEGELNLECELWGEVFEPLKQKSVFKSISLNSELGTIAWPNGADFAPDFLYRRLFDRR